MENKGTLKVLKHVYWTNIKKRCERLMSWLGKVKGMSESSGKKVMVGAFGEKRQKGRPRRGGWKTWAIIVWSLSEEFVVKGREQQESGERWWCHTYVRSNYLILSNDLYYQPLIASIFVIFCNLYILSNNTIPKHICLAVYFLGRRHTTSFIRFPKLTLLWGSAELKVLIRI